MNAREAVACDLCGADQPRRLFERAGFPIVECAACGLVYVSPRLRAEALARVYDRDYFRSRDSVVHGYEDYFADRDNLRRTFARRLATWPGLRARRGLRVLDVGCAAGFLLEQIREWGWDGVGVELSPVAAAFARERLGVNVIEGQLHAAALPAAHFDLVVMWDAIEHLPSPRRALLEAARVLKPGGLLSLVTPDRSSVLARLSGRHWVEYAKPDEHLYFFSWATLSPLLRATGFDPQRRLWAGKYASVDFALRRLSAVSPRALGPLVRIARWVQLERRVWYVNPRDKLLVWARKRME